MAPKCARCDVSIIGHGVQAYGAIYCCAHCARGEGVDRVRDRVS
jgi:ornithine cyclodeaminase/alanine dehydrogenase-like protein (mu-crystallin family)